MNPATGALLGGIGGDFIGGLFGNSAQKKANRTNIMLQRENQAWQERMSNTAWQRGTEDMLAAGLNPMLSFSQGGASTPSTSAATVNPVDALGKGVSSAASKAMQAISLQQGLANIELTKANTDKALTEAQVAAGSREADIAIRQQTAERLRVEIGNMVRDGHIKDEQARQLRSMIPLLMEASQAETQLKKLQVPSAKAEAELWERMGSNAKGASWVSGFLKDFLTIYKGTQK